jgi:hypothetical protein
MSALPEWDGLLQGAMSGVANVWYAFEIAHPGDT